VRPFYVFKHPQLGADLTFMYKYLVKNELSTLFHENRTFFHLPWFILEQLFWRILSPRQKMNSIEPVLPLYYQHKLQTKELKEPIMGRVSNQLNNSHRIPQWGGGGVR
jgi:hypothetical protein